MLSSISKYVDTFISEINGNKMSRSRLKSFLDQTANDFEKQEQRNNKDWLDFLSFFLLGLCNHLPNILIVQSAQTLISTLEVSFL